MAFSEFRTPCSSPLKPIFEIERFAYDVFAYMLRICGCPEQKIPVSSVRANNYKEVDFVRNVGLSVLPISLYMRDEWRTMFEETPDENNICDIFAINSYLRSFVKFSGEIEEEDTMSKIQYSLALYNEYMLYLNSSDIENNFDILPKLWSYICKQFEAEDEDGDQTLESMLTMGPDITESWIIDFMRRFAIPYGSLDNVSERFSEYIISCRGGGDSLSDETSTNSAGGYVPEEYGDSDKSEDTMTNSLECSNSELGHVPNVSSSADSSSEQEKMKCMESTSYDLHKNGFFYVLNRCLKGKKRTRSPDSNINNAFANINLKTGDISPEQHDTKRRRKISGKDKLD